MTHLGQPRALGKCEPLPVSGMTLSASRTLPVEVAKEMKRHQGSWEKGDRHLHPDFQFSVLFPLLLLSAEASCVDLPVPAQNLKQPLLTLPVSVFTHRALHSVRSCSKTSLPGRGSLLLFRSPQKEVIDVLTDQPQILAKRAGS